MRTAYINSASETFSFAHAWLSDAEFDATISDMATLALQRRRLAALTTREGFVRPKVHPVSRVAYGVELSLSAGRYASTLDRRFHRLTSKLLTDPRLDETTDRDR